MKNYIKYMAILALGVVSCEPELENSIEDDGFYSNGEADFSNYVALGNSLTAGYADGALYITGQQNSYPNIIASKMELAAEGDFDFTQPLVNDNIGGLLLGGNQIQQPRFVLAGESALTARPARLNATPTTEVSNKLTGPFNNMGVPGAKSFHLLAPGYGNVAGVPSGMANPYFARFASSEGTTIVADAVAQNPTFFTLWIGNNDVLSFATSGGDGVYQQNNTDFATYGPNDITDPNAFAFVYNSIVSELAGEDGSSAEGVLINIPNVTDIPFFNVVPVNPIPLDANTAAALNAQFGAYNTQILPGLVQAGILTEAEANSRKIIFTESNQNFVTLVDEDLTNVTGILQQAPFNLDPQTAALLGQLRQATSEDLIPLTSSSFIGTTVNNNPMLVNGVSVPLGDEHVLTASEQEIVAQVTTQYNAAIASIAQNYSLGLVDANALLSQIGASGGLNYQGIPITSQFVTGGAFSLDGVHLTPRGNAVIANEIIKVINANYEANLPNVDVGSYGTVSLSNNVQ
ncbi:G-D-S-L family lipolytic protein [Gramella sp. GC03-9]|uniref:G-D-S-L family lipolytic protein n=1 Tax=Christiangramia oceanisediminis TaxID=2920386 RepID=A0A9X2KVW3_9FLAO|nr:G-D-S-L family lipolytic protein [Gramella oceanisediminis]MCP9198629.1 G-D-S-L family lipolytic protein [Gramella oceanisediminis]